MPGAGREEREVSSLRRGRDTRAQALRAARMPAKAGAWGSRAWVIGRGGREEPVCGREGIWTSTERLRATRARCKLWREDRS